MRKIKKLVVGTLTASIFFGQIVYAEEMQVDFKVPNSETSKEKIVDVKISEDLAWLDEVLPETREDLPQDSKTTVDNIQNLAKENGMVAAESLNQIQDIDVYEVALREVLDNYYTEDSVGLEEQMIEFSETVDERAEGILSSYEEAKEERDNSENLDYEAGRVLVTFKAGTKEEDISEIADRMGGNYSILNNCPINQELPQHTLKRLENISDQEFPIIAYMDIGIDKTVKKAEDILNCLSCVSESDVNGIATHVESLKTDLDVNDPFVEQQTYLRQIGIPKVWLSWLEPDGASMSIDVAVIDTGLDILHEDLKKQYVADRSVSLIHNGTNVEIQKMNTENDYLKNIEGSYHGTHVAGIIAARSNNKKGVVGITSMENSIYQSGDMYKIMAINASSVGKDKYGDPTCVFYDSDLIVAINYAVNNGAGVINMSLGGEGYNSAMQEAINYAHAAGVIICAAAGNDGKNIMFYPACYNHVISVGSVDDKNNRSDFSNFGDCLDIMAPGEDIYNCVTGSYYASLSGTSMASPMVASAAALLYSMNSYEPSLYRLTIDEVESILCNTATDLQASGKDIYTGYGLLNLNLAIQTAKGRFVTSTSPKKVKATRKSFESVAITWEPVAWADRYQVYRATAENATYNKIKVIHVKELTEGGGNIKYIDTGLDTGKTYYYKIRAVSEYQDKFKYSGYSTVVNAKPTLLAPEISLTASTGKISISWGKINGAEGYGVFRSTSKNGTYTRIKKITNGSTLTFVDTSVKAGTTYYYKVRAFRDVNGKSVTSEFSNIAYKKAK